MNKKKVLIAVGIVIICLVAVALFWTYSASGYVEPWPSQTGVDGEWSIGLFFKDVDGNWNGVAEPMAIFYGSKAYTDLRFVVSAQVINTVAGRYTSCVFSPTSDMGVRFEVYKENGTNWDLLKGQSVDALIHDSAGDETPFLDSKSLDTDTTAQEFYFSDFDIESEMLNEEDGDYMLMMKAYGDVSYVSVPEGASGDLAMPELVVSLNFTKLPDFTFIWTLEPTVHGEIDLPKTGDMNGDSLLNMGDVRYLSIHLEGTDPDYEILHADPDVNCDGLVNEDDVEYLTHHLSIPESYPLYPC